MSLPTLSPPTNSDQSDVVTGIERAEEIERSEPRNILVLAAHELLVRVAWIFKTESVIMPAVVDAISGAGWVRGCLPVLNRIGQSVAPMLLAERLRDSRLKRRSLMATSLLMAVPFYGLALLWWLVAEKRQAWLVGLFLVLYVLFFAFVGLHQLASGTVQGKLIRADRRGRLLSLSGIFGSSCAILAAWLLMIPWLEMPNGTGYVWIFTFTASGFFIAAFVTLLIAEPPDEDVHTPHRTLRDHAQLAWSVYRGDRSFRRAANVGMLFIGAIMLFPHYRWLAAERLGSRDVDMAWWVIAQNAGVGVLSLVSGTIADRYGNRLAMRIQIFASALIPLLALVMAGPLAYLGAGWYWVVFLCLGLTPITLKTVFNYTLELVDEPQHPRYLSTMRICFAVPFVLSPLAGLWIDLFPPEQQFTAVCWLFGFVSLLILLGGVLTFGMEEPRHRPVDTSELPPLRG
jgi:MFS family permease